MKTTLTPEQSATLIAKGISADKASERTPDYKDINSTGKTLERRELLPIFTLADVCALLPKEVVTDTIMRENDVCPISIRWDKNCQKWFVGYDLVPRPVGVGVDSELIDALFSTLCWVTKNGLNEVNFTKMNREKAIDNLSIAFGEYRDTKAASRVNRTHD